MRKVYLLSLLLLCLCGQAFAQYNIAQNNNWYIGTNVGVNFNSGSPVSFVSTHFFPEGSAHVSDARGNTLFFTDGRKVHNRTGGVMLGGDSLQIFPTWSSVNAASIIPVIGNPDRYYIFSMEQFESAHGRLAYSIVDMTLDGGLGGVVPGSSGIVLDSGYAEKMTVIRGTNCNIWLVTHLLFGNKFHAYSVSSSGISAAVVSATGPCSPSDGCYGSGGMSTSPNGLTIATSSDSVKLHDFNPATGVVSNPRAIYGDFSYFQDFSPDGTKLYTADFGGSGEVYQFDLSLPTTAAITASRTTLSTGGGWSGAMRLAPDGKIYVQSTDIHKLHCINYPNLAGTACGFASNALNLASGSHTDVGMTVNYVKLIPSMITGSVSVCVGGTTALTPSVAGGTWSSEATTASVSSAGVVTGVTPGICTIKYVVTTSCGTDTTFQKITVYSTAHCDSALSVTMQDADNKGLTLFPNPTHDNVTITSGTAIGNIVVSNMVGQRVYEASYNTCSATINMVYLPQGIYIIKAGDRGVYKVLKE